MGFDVQREMRIDGSPGKQPGTYDLRSDGLAKAGRPELVMSGVPAALARQGGTVMNLVAHYVTNQKPVASGETIATDHPDSSSLVVVRLVDEKNGFFSKRTQRIEDVCDAGQPYVGMLTTVALWQVESAVNAGKRDVAIAELENLVRMFPGDPSRANDGPTLGTRYNWQNALCYARLGRLVPGAEGRKYLEAAYARSSQLRIGDVGDRATPDARLADLEALTLRAGQIVSENQRTTELRPMKPGLLLSTSPILRCHEPGDGRRVASRQASPIPAPFVQYYYQGPTAARLVGDRELHAIAARAVHGHWANPASLVLVCDDIADFYGDQHGGPQRNGSEYVVGDRLLSLVLADMGRALAAGLDARELTVRYGIDGGEEELRSGARKLAALAEREGPIFGAALTPS